MGQAEVWQDALAALRDAARLRQTDDAGNAADADVRERRRRALLTHYRTLMDDFARTQLTGTRG